jgi:hypothetical protein
MKSGYWAKFYIIKVIIKSSQLSSNLQFMLFIFPVCVSAPVRTKSCASIAGNVPTNSLRTANPNFTSTERRAVTSYRGFLETAGCSPPALPSPKEKIYFTELCPLIRLINPEKSRFEIISLAVFTKETS